MIIGNGLLAQAFNPYYYDTKEIIVFASGVSNSLCVDPKEYEREKQLLKSTAYRFKNHKAFIYFSTCSIYDISIKKSPYIIHKIQMERLVRDCSNAYVYRLPQIASNRKGNSNNLLNFLYNSIKNETTIEIWKNAYRNIIDILDIPPIVSQLLRKKAPVVNIANSTSHSILDILQIFEDTLGKNGSYKLVDKGSNFKIDTSIMESFIKYTNIRFDDKYLNRVMRRYYKRL